MEFQSCSDPAYTAAKKLQVNADESSDDLANPPKVEEKLGAVPHGLSTDSEVAQRCARPSHHCFVMLSTLL